MDPVGWCAPHLVSGVYEHATTLVSGMSMCTPHAVATLTAQSSSTGGTSTTGGVVIKLT
jgi:hypothetical protein